MKNMRYSLRTLIILMGAVPLWIYLTAIISTENRAQTVYKPSLLVTPMLLAGIAAALYRLTKSLPDGLAIAVLLSPIIPLAWMLAVRTINTLWPLHTLWP